MFDHASGKIVITYQTFIVRTPQHTILVDTCTGEDKGYPAPMDFPKQPWLDGFAAAGLRFEDIDYVFCTHLHIDHCGWNTRLVDGPLGAHLSPRQICLLPRRIRRVGGKDRRRRQPAWRRLDHELPPDRGSRTGAAGRRRLCARRHHLPLPEPGDTRPAIAASTSARKARPPSSPATWCTTRCRCANPAGRRSSALTRAGRDVAPTLLRRRRRHRHDCAAGAFPAPDRRPDRGRRRPLQLPARHRLKEAVHRVQRPIALHIRKRNAGQQQRDHQPLGG